MASIRKMTTIDVSPDTAWDALRDWGAVHTRLAPDFALSAFSEGEYRTVTLFNGTVLRERLVTVNDEARRLAWTIDDASLGLEHFNASQRIATDQDGRTQLVWIADLLPHERKAAVEELMDRGLAAIKSTLEERQGRLPSAREAS